MGLGKTVQALALIVARPSPVATRKTTLIVAPLALLRQWEKEIDVKIKPTFKLKVMILYGEQRWTPLSELLDHDIVLCTYGILRSEYRNLTDNLDPAKLRVLDPRARFHRVILDEAHNIKNRLSKVSHAAAALRATYRLCMTGTPLMNCATEIFPLIRFLGTTPYNDWAMFSDNIDRPILKWGGPRGAEGMRILQTLLRNVMLRRNKDSRLDGRPIIQLPLRNDVIAYAEFDEEQNTFYMALELQQRLRFNKYLKAGTVMKNYAIILVLLLRLRQACDHPHLIKDHSALEGLDLYDDEMRNLILSLDDHTVKRVRSLKELVCPMCQAKPDDPLHVHPCGHHICPQCFAASVKRSQPEFCNDEEIDYLVCHHKGCGVQITSRNIFLHSSFVDAYAHTRAKADDDNLGIMANGGHDADSFDGPADHRGVENDEPDNDDCDCDDECDDECDCDCHALCHCEECDCEYDCRYENCTCDSCECISRDGSFEGMFVSSEGQDQPVVQIDAEEPSLDNISANENAADFSTEEHEGRSSRGSLGDGVVVKSEVPQDAAFIRPLALHGTAQNPIVVDEDDTKKVVRPRIPVRSNAFDDCVRPRKRKHRKKREQSRKRCNHRKNSSSNKRRRLENSTTGSVGAIDHEMVSRNSLTREAVHGRGHYAHDDSDDSDDSPVQFLFSLSKKRSSAKSAAAQYQYHLDLRADYVSSAKIDKIVSLLASIRKKRPKEKTLIFSLWPSFLDLVEVAIDAQNFIRTRYDGSMQADERYASVQNFQDNPAVEVMLVSLTAGNAGLNLTAATQIIIAEPFWNPYVEEQAIDRAHRIGQMRSVTVHRVLVRGTVEDRVLSLQDKKRNLVNAALGEQGGNQAGGLTVRELEGLFGG